MPRITILTSESVSEGHPDKVCDIIADSLVDLYLAADPDAHTAFEVMAAEEKVILAGEVWSVKGAAVSTADIEACIRAAVRRIGYEGGGFNWRDLALHNYLQEQSEDIRRGIRDDGAGDQGVMFGYASDETPEYLPAGLVVAHRIVRTLAEGRREGSLPELRPDAKSQVSMVYEDGKPVSIDSMVVSTQHSPDLAIEDVASYIRPALEEALAPLSLPDRLYINPAGKFVIGGPAGDTGLTGRKIIIDSYGGAAPHGGGAFSGKDPSKVDRSAAYAGRYLAKNVVAAGLARRCVIQLSYAIGLPDPLSIAVETYGTARCDEAALEAVLRDVMDLSPQGICSHLRLNRPIYTRTAAYGHFGHAPEADGGFSWEKTDLVTVLKERLGDKIPL